jgi:hypothetical protein
MFLPFDIESKAISFTIRVILVLKLIEEYVRKETSRTDKI